MKYIGFSFALLLLGSLSAGCNNNPTGPGGSAWSQCEGLPDLPITGFAATGNNLVAGSYNAPLSQAYIFISFNNGLSWSLDTTFHTKNHSPGTYYFVGTPVTFLSDAGYLFAGIAGDGGNMYVSTNGGRTWVERDTNFVQSVWCLAASRGAVLAGTGQGVFRSTDHGTSWIAANKGLSSTVSGLAVVGTSIFACTEGEGIYKSVNGAMIWAEVNTTEFDFHSLAAIAGQIFAGFPGGYSNGGVLESADNGATWRLVDAGLANSSVNVLCVNGSNLFAGTNEGVFLTTNMGGYWMDTSTGTSVDSSATISLFVSGSFLFAGTNDRGAWRYPVFLK